MRLGGVRGAAPKAKNQAQVHDIQRLRLGHGSTDRELVQLDIVGRAGDASKVGAGRRRLKAENGLTLSHRARIRSRQQAHAVRTEQRQRQVADGPRVQGLFRSAAGSFQIGRANRRQDQVQFGVADHLKREEIKVRVVINADEIDIGGGHDRIVHRVMTNRKCVARIQRANGRGIGRIIIALTVVGPFPDIAVTAMHTANIVELGSVKGGINVGFHEKGRVG